MGVIVLTGATGTVGGHVARERDVAAVAAAVLTQEGHEGRAYELTGPEALAPADIATTLSAATGRELRYEDVPAEAVRQAMLGGGMPEWLAGAITEVMQHTREGEATPATPAVADLLGRPPRSYERLRARVRRSVRARVTLRRRARGAAELAGVPEVSAIIAA